MDTLRTFVDIVLHLDQHLNAGFIASYGYWMYGFVFVLVFCETGLVVTPFLPGDSLLFAAGTLTALDTSGTLNIGLLYVLVACAALGGDTLNYGIGHTIGLRLFDYRLPFLKREHLDRTHAFYEKYGGKTIVLARFVPIVRTFAPFVAGVGSMHYGTFLRYNLIGGVLWTALFTFGGYLFGNIPIVKHNFEFVTLGIILISIIPMIVEYLRNRRAPARQAEG